MALKVHHLFVVFQLRDTQVDQFYSVDMDEIFMVFCLPTGRTVGPLLANRESVTGPVEQTHGGFHVLGAFTRPVQQFKALKIGGCSGAS